MPNQNVNVRLLEHVVRYIVSEARTLFTAGTGEDFDDGAIDGFPGELDNIPSDTETYRWASAMTSFLRYLIHILEYSLETPAPMLEDITNVFNDENEI